MILGLLGLSRQWGFMLFPAIVVLMILVWALGQHDGSRTVKALAASLVIAVAICGWFYVGLFARYGSFTAFNRAPRPLAFSNQPIGFYRNTGLKDLRLFRSPTRGTFDNQLLPTFYSEVWGDYWGYFVLIPERASLTDDRYEQNADRMTPYLGRVNAAALLPSLIFAAGVVTGIFSLPRRRREEGEGGRRSFFWALLLTFVISAFLLYLYFSFVSLCRPTARSKRPSFSRAVGLASSGRSSWNRSGDVCHPPTTSAWSSSSWCGCTTFRP
jgi:hypothetical protein